MVLPAPWLPQREEPSISVSGCGCVNIRRSLTSRTECFCRHSAALLAKVVQADCDMPCCPASPGCGFTSVRQAEQQQHAVLAAPTVYIYSIESALPQHPPPPAWREEDRLLTSFSNCDGPNKYFQAGHWTACCRRQPSDSESAQTAAGGAGTVDDGHTGRSASRSPRPLLSAAPCTASWHRPRTLVPGRSAGLTARRQLTVPSDRPSSRRTASSADRPAP